MNAIIKRLSQKNLFILYLLVAYLFGPALASLLPLAGEEFRYNFNFFSLLLTLSGAILAFLISYTLAKNLLISRKSFLSRIENNTSPKVFYYTGILLCCISLISLLAYVASHGISLGGSSYENRYYNNVGAGFITKMFIMFPLGFLIALYCGQKKIKTYKHGAIVFSYGLLLAVATGGYRQVMLIGIISFVLTAFISKSISKKEVIVISISSVVLVAAIGAIRNVGLDYDGEISYAQYIYATIDSFAPFDSYLKIKDYVDANEAPGVLVFINHFLSYIPRFLWETKPFLVLNSGNYFTIFILEYSRDVTISPTVFGEYYLMGGWLGFFGGCMFTGLILAFYDAMFAFGRTRIGTVFFMFFFYAPFGLVREGLAVYITTLLWILAVFFLSLFIVKVTVRASKRY